MSYGLTRRRFIAAALLTAGLQTGILVTMMRSSQSILDNGTAIRLKTVPVDPRDLMRGDYVVLAYDFSQLDTKLIRDAFPTASGLQTVSLRLAPGPDGFWIARDAAFGALQPELDTVILKSFPFDYEPQQPVPDRLTLNFGIESYFVAEGQGKAIEEARNNHQVAVEVRVSPEGDARIASLEVLNAAP